MTVLRAATASQTATALRLASTHSAQDDAHGHGAASAGGHGGGHDDHFDPPGGWLWGQRPGEKYEKEGWEGLAWVFVGCWVVAIAAYTMKEDTSYVPPLPSFLFYSFSFALAFRLWIDSLFCFVGVGMGGQAGSNCVATGTEEEEIENIKGAWTQRAPPSHLP
jgi:hypothetical protein